MSNKQQTPMQQHIEWLNHQLQQCIQDGDSESWIFAYNRSIKHAEAMLLAENAAIIDAWSDGHYGDLGPSNGKQYYEQTYGEPKP